MSFGCEYCNGDWRRETSLYTLPKDNTHLQLILTCPVSTEYILTLGNNSKKLYFLSDAIFYVLFYITQNLHFILGDLSHPSFAILHICILY